MKTYILPEELRNAMLDYLSNKPYKEVATAMEMLSKLEEIPAGE